MQNKLHYPWPIKFVLAIIITQMLMMAQLGNLQIDFSALTKNTTVNIFTPCPKVEIQSKIVQQLCHSYLNISFNSLFATLSFILLTNKFTMPADYLKRYKILIYSMDKPPKTNSF